jgi:hypothetical protein
VLLITVLVKLVDRYYVNITIKCEEGMYSMVKKFTKLVHGELGSLQEIADTLHRRVRKEFEANGHTDLSLALEGLSRGIGEILRLNNVREGRLDSE